MRQFIEYVGQKTVSWLDEIGYMSLLFADCVYWIVIGKSKKQAVKIADIISEATKIGVNAALISSLLCFAVGVMLAIQGVETLKPYGAESKVITGIALSITREFAPLIVGILIAGRSGSAITARIGTMLQSQEIDALRVIGINPVRFLAAPVLLAMFIAVPTLTVLGDFMGLYGGAVYVSSELHISLGVYFERVLSALSLADIHQGLIKSIVFAYIIAIVSLSNGFQVRGGAEGVGTATTRSVVASISYIILADMVFTFLLNQ